VILRNFENKVSLHLRSSLSLTVCIMHDDEKENTGGRKITLTISTSSEIHLFNQNLLKTLAYGQFLI